MGQPAVVAGDQVQGQCVGHQIPSPVGAPMPAPPLPFQAPLTVGLSTSVFVAGTPFAVVGSKGYNLPPHVGLHPSDPKMAPPLQEAQVVMGSSSVLVEGKAAAYTGCTVTGCLARAPMVNGSGSSVLVGP